MFESTRRSFYSGVVLMGLGQTESSWTREQVAGWVERAGIIISDHPDCSRPIYDELKAWLSRNPGSGAIYVYRKEDPERLNEIFLCGKSYGSSVPIGVKILLAALGLGAVGGVTYYLSRIK